MDFVYTGTFLWRKKCSTIQHCIFPKWLLTKSILQQVLLLAPFIRPEISPRVPEFNFDTFFSYLYCTNLITIQRCKCIISNWRWTWCIYVVTVFSPLIQIFMWTAKHSAQASCTELDKYFQGLKNFSFGRIILRVKVRKSKNKFWCHDFLWFDDCTV